MSAFDSSNAAYCYHHWKLSTRRSWGMIFSKSMTFQIFCPLMWKVKPFWSTIIHQQNIIKAVLFSLHLMASTTTVLYIISTNFFIAKVNDFIATDCQRLKGSCFRDCLNESKAAYAGSCNWFTFLGSHFWLFGRFPGIYSAMTSSLFFAASFLLEISITINESKVGLNEGDFHIIWGHITLTLSTGISVCRIGSWDWQDYYRKL